MSDPLNMQHTLLHQIGRALDNFKKMGRNNHTAAKIRSRMTSLKDTWNQCLQGHAAVLQAYPSAKREKVDYFQDNQMDIYADLYQTTLDYMAECLEEVEPNVSTNQSLNASTQSDNSSLSLKHLPAIQLPPFSGKFEEWESFRDRFTSLIIQNKEISDFCRMHFLASSLTGLARDAIASIAVTADNFNIAWKALTARFENKRRLIEVHVSILCNLPSASRESASELHALRDKADKALASLKRLDRSSDDILNDVLVYCVSQKLDPATRRAWKLKFSEESPPATYRDLSRFLSSRAVALEELKPVKSLKYNNELKITSATVSAASDPICVLCQKRHFINKCTKFIEKSPSQRREIVKQHKRCFNCLSSKHVVSECKSKFTCRQCQKKHHSMLHIDSPSSSITNSAVIPAAQPIQSTEDSPVNALSAVSVEALPSPVFLATARVVVRSPLGRAQTVRALLDQGSEVSFITENLAQALRLRRIRTMTSISGVGGIEAGICRHAANIKITPRDKNGPIFNTTAFVMKSLTKYSPPRAQFDNAWEHLKQLNLADNDPAGSDPIDILIGADLYSSILLDGVRKGTVGQPMAQNSHFGWVISGPIASQGSCSRSFKAMHCTLEQELNRFWEVEELPPQSTLAPDDRLCEEHFLSNYSRDQTGRYIVRLPFKKGPPIDIGDSRSTASRMLATLNRQLNRNSELKKEYDSFLSEYEQLGHMERIPTISAAESHSQQVYIPHHAVVRNSSSTTRVRVVFNASSVTTNGTSLNSHLLSGPKLQTDLFEILLRWRQPQYVYIADIAKMYRQILIDPRDRDYQRILWNAEASPMSQEYRLKTVTYGTASAPFLALRVLKQLLQDEGESFPLALPILQDNIYVDDVLFGAEDIPLLRHTRDQVCALLQRGGFKLRKWASNKSEMLTDIPMEDHGLACNKILKPDKNELIRVGGRIENSPLPFRTKHPILLASHPLVKMIIRHAHIRSLHAGIQLTLSTLRQEYWILRARTLVKSELHRCVTCARAKAVVPNQLMGQLPRARVSAPARAFLHCGVDFAGPVAIRASYGRGITSRKAYIAVFICLATRAIHLELVGGYSTATFLDAYTRFCARRGLPTDMYSDNGTNFTGADKELSKAYQKSLRDPDFQNKTASDKVSWHFIPPHAPHFGGLWEAGVHSIKHHLRRILGAHTLTFEEFATLLCKIEACLNSRPLQPLTASIDDYETLTPGHFLIGSAITTIPEPSVLSLKENRLSRWQLVRQLTERFWKIWQNDYINTLQQRAKWRKAQPSIQNGTMVLIRNANLPPCKWELGRIIQGFAGSDGLVRVVLVRTANSEYKRPIAQLCVLPIDVDARSENVSDTQS